VVSVAGTPGPGRGPAADDGFVYDVERSQRLQGFTLQPVAPEAIETRLAAGDRLAVVDLPGRLDRRLHVDAGTGTVLYRLVELFGTPNVPGFEAGADQPPRERTTWRYLFETTYEPVPEGEIGIDDGETAVWATPRECLVAVYDWKTNVSVGVATWEPAGLDDRAAQLPEPGADGDLPPGVDAEPFLVGLVQLVVATVEEPVGATYKGQWI
jgi:hypothetical protein